MKIEKILLKFWQFLFDCEEDTESEIDKLHRINSRFVRRNVPRAVLVHFVRNKMREKVAIAF